MVNRFGINLKMSGHLQIMKVTNYILQCKSQYRNKYAYTYLSIPTKHHSHGHFVEAENAQNGGQGLNRKPWRGRGRNKISHQEPAQLGEKTASNLSTVLRHPRLHYGLNVSSSQRFSSSACGNSTDARRKTSKFHQHCSHKSEL